MNPPVQFTKIPSWRPMDEDGDGARWSGKGPAFPIGARVIIRLNGWRIAGKPHEVGDIPGTVVGYRIDGGFLMACVEPDFRPAWHMKDAPDRKICVFAGCELEEVS